MIQVREIIAMTALNFGLDATELTADNRSDHVCMARHVAMYVARKATRLSLPALGRVFNKDHTTILHGVEKIDAEIKAAPASPLAALIKAIMRNVEFRARIEALGGVAVLDVARRIATDPVRQAMSASVMEVSALAATVIDLWEVALAAEEAVRLERRQMEISSDLPMTAALAAEEEENAARIAGLHAAILDELTAMRGPSAGPRQADNQPQEEK